LNTDRHDPNALAGGAEPGTATGRGITAHSPALAKLDREINVRGILWTGVVLVVVALVAHLLIWWLLRGFRSYDERHDVRLTPIEAAAPQPPPPEPRLQVDANEDMRRMRAQEEQALATARWINRQQGVVRVPIDVAIDVIAQRGVSPQVVGGKGTAATPAPSPPQPSSPQGRGGSSTNSNQVPLSPSGREGPGE
jgi:hypothetical protein